MTTISFTVDGPAGKGGTARFEPRAMFEADGKLVTSWASPRLVKYTNNTAVAVEDSVGQKFRYLNLNQKRK